MAFNKHFYKQFGDDIEKEVKEFEAKEEKKEILFKRCPHKNLVPVDDGVKCLDCRAGWMGARKQELIGLLTRGIK